MAIVDKGDGMEIDPIAAVDDPYDAIALCNLLNAPNAPRPAFGLWHALSDSVRAALEQAEAQMVDNEDDRYIAPMFLHVIKDEDDPGAELGGMADVDWASLFKPTGCPEEGCENCSGCSDGRCRPGGSCECLLEDADGCVCIPLRLGPRWAAGIYDSLCGMAEALFEHGQQLLWGVEEPVACVPHSLTGQSPHFYVRLAETCATLAKLLAKGQAPIPLSIAELVMLERGAADDIAARSGGRDGNELFLDDVKHLPEGHGDFEMGALWMFQFTEFDWEAIRDQEHTFKLGSADFIFDLPPERGQSFLPE
jgi:hypothetical protein